MSLEDQIAERAKEIRTDGYAMSIGEVISLYKDRDIEVHPEFQRIFRWTIEQKSRLVESLLLGIPVPSIFVSQRDDGVWDVIDGVQRLSTILEFVGVYRDENDELLPSSTLVATEYLPGLAGYTWEVRGHSGKVLSEPLKRAIKRAKLEFRIVQKESDPNAKYDLFQRLNSGTDLSPQEARDCLLVMLNPDMFDEIAGLADLEAFKNVVPLTERKENESYRKELVLRFFCQEDFSGPSADLRYDFGEYLTNWMRGAAGSFGGDEDLVDSGCFDRVFTLLNSAVGEDAFRRFDGERHLGSFSISAYEFITSGLARNIDYWEQARDQLPEKIQKVWSYPTFRTSAGAGTSPRSRFPRLVNAARAFFAEA